jgi:hypothetical protein
MPSEATSMPLADYLVSQGVDPAQAALLGQQGDALAGKFGAEAKAVMTASVSESQPAAAKPAPSSTVTQQQAVDAVNAHNEAQLQSELDATYAPPVNAYEYRIPQASGGELSDEAMAADRALVTVLHSERMPLHIGNAIMQDLARGRPSQVSAEEIAALTPWAQQMLTSAQGHAALREIVAAGATPEQWLSILSPETRIAVRGLVDYSARRR